MPRRTTFEEPDDDFEGEYTHPDDIEYDPELEDNDREFTEGDSPDVPCPHCGEMITEDHQRCPHCEAFITKEYSPAEKKSPFVMIMLGVSLLIVIVFWVVS